MQHAEQSTALSGSAGFNACLLILGATCLGLALLLGSLAVTPKPVILDAVQVVSLLALGTVVLCSGVALFIMGWQDAPRGSSHWARLKRALYEFL